jgi:predicted acyltransferase
MSVSTTSTPARLVSLDAYRGFIMLVMASGGFAFAEVAKNHFPENPAWDFLASQFSHVAWTGCSFWDLIQPSFMFMVGVAMPYSHASRRAKGQSTARIGAHVLFRSFILIALGVFLSSNWSKQTDFTFVNVLTQIGLGYAFVYLLLGRGLVVQVVVALGILAGYWLLFFHDAMPLLYTNYPVLADDPERFTGLFEHWNKYTNFATAFDQWFLGFFPHSSSYPFNKGGYQTLNFVPSMATMIFGLIAGEWLRGPKEPQQKFNCLFVAGAICLVSGLVLNYTVCPSVKRIWTPSWAIFSSGWTYWMLAAFYWVIDLYGYRRWAFPFVVVGMNSIAMYCMSQLMKSWVRQSLRTHLNYGWDWTLSHITNDSTREMLQTDFGKNLFEGVYGPIVASASVLGVLWLICLWMYRRGIFIRI